MRKKYHRSRLLNPFNCFWSDLFIAKRYKRKRCKRGKLIPTKIPTGIRCQAASGRVPFTALKRFNAFLKGNSSSITDWLNKFSSIAERNTISDSLMSNISKNLSISATKSTYVWCVKKRPTRKPSSRNDVQLFLRHQQTYQHKRGGTYPLTYRFSLLSKAIFFFSSLKSDSQSKTVLTRVMAEKNLEVIKRLPLKEAISLDNW